MSSPSTPNWLAELIAAEGESKPMDVHEREALLGALAAAQNPLAIDSERHHDILQRALGVPDPFAPPTDEELAAAAELREHLDSNPLVMSLRSAQASAAPAPAVEAQLRQQALRDPPVPLRRAPRRIHAYWGTLAVAAAVALWFVAKSSGTFSVFQPPVVQRSLAVSRSTEPLFAKSFNTTSASERIDRIAQVRAKDLRHNRYAIWGLP